MKPPSDSKIFILLYHIIVPLLYHKNPAPDKPGAGFCLQDMVLLFILLVPFI